jgi:sulfide:quinone oxidoreductase
MTAYAALTPELSVTGQIRADDIGHIAAHGFRTIINNRPDGEAPDQPGSEEVAAEARAHGLEYRYLPVISGKISDADVAALGLLVADLPKPILMYCRTGNRSTTLWALHEASRRDADSIIAVCRQAGFNLEALRPRLLTRQARTT